MNKWTHDFSSVRTPVFLWHTSHEGMDRLFIILDFLLRFQHSVPVIRVRALTSPKDILNNTAIE